MKKNAKLAPLQTSLKQVAVFLHNADFLRLRVTKLPPNSPAERCCFALVAGCWKNYAGLWWYWLLKKLCWFVVVLVAEKIMLVCGGIGCWKKLCHFCWVWEDFAGLVEALYLFTTANYDGLLAMEGVLLYTLYSRKIVLWWIMR